MSKGHTKAAKECRKAISLVADRPYRKYLKAEVKDAMGTDREAAVLAEATARARQATSEAARAGRATVEAVEAASRSDADDHAGAAEHHRRAAKETAHGQAGQAAHHRAAKAHDRAAGAE